MAKEKSNTNPFANLDEETQNKIQELQMLEHHFQQLMMQKNAFSMESNETNLIIKELEKTDGEVLRIIGNQVAIKSSKEKVLEEMKKKQELIDTRLNSLKTQEKEFSERIDSLRDEIMKKIKR
jgi:prefoldin beta subunit